MPAEPDLRVVSDSAQGQGPMGDVQESITEVVDAAAAASGGTPATQNGNGGASPWLTVYALEAALAAGSGSFVGFTTAAKTRRGRGSLIGALAGFGTYALVRATLKPVVLTNQGAYQIQGGMRAAVGFAGLLSFGGAIYLGYFRKG